MAALASPTQPAISHDLGSVPASRWAIHSESLRLSSASQPTVHVMTQGRSRMRELRTYGSERRALGNQRPYRDLFSGDEREEAFDLVEP